MPRKPEPELLIELKPSRRLMRALVITHMLALASSLANTLPIAVKLVLLAGICGYFYFSVKGLKTGRYSIQNTQAHGWEVSDGDDFKQIQVLNSTVITQLAVFLHYRKNAHKRQSMLIMNDALSEDDFRRLIVRLKTDGIK